MCSMSTNGFTRPYFRNVSRLMNYWLPEFQHKGYSSISDFEKGKLLPVLRKKRMVLQNRVNYRKLKNFKGPEKRKKKEQMGR